MIFYIVNLVFLEIFAYACEISKATNKRKLMVLWGGAQLFLVAAIRLPTVGGDLGNYLPWYSIIARTPLSQLDTLHQYMSTELGYNFFCKLFSYISDSDRWYLIVTSLAALCGSIYVIYKYSYMPWFSFFVYITFGFYTNAFSAVRQYIAISILLFSIKFIKERQGGKFLLLVLLAASFHKTALCFILLYPLSKLRFNWKYVLIIGVTSIFLLLSGKHLILLIANVFPLYAGYASLVGEGNGDGQFIMIVGILLVTYVFRRQLFFKDKNAYIYVHMMVLALLFSILGFYFSLISRLLDYFMIIIIVLLPNILSSISYRNKIIGIIFVGLCTSFYWYYFLFRLNQNAVFPYAII